MPVTANSQSTHSAVPPCHREFATAATPIAPPPASPTPRPLAMQRGRSLDHVIDDVARVQRDAAAAAPVAVRPNDTPSVTARRSLAKAHLQALRTLETSPDARRLRKLLERLDLSILIAIGPNCTWRGDEPVLIFSKRGFELGGFGTRSKVVGVWPIGLRRFLGLGARSELADFKPCEVETRLAQEIERANLVTTDQGIQVPFGWRRDWTLLRNQLFQLPPGTDWPEHLRACDRSGPVPLAQAQATPLFSDPDR